MSNVILVDKNDQPIGVKPRLDLNPVTDIFRCTGLWIVNSQNQVLIAQRSFKKKNSPGKWGPAAAGTVEEGETYESNIYKEAQEELGLTGIDFILGPKVFLRDSRRQFGQWFLAQVDKSITDFIIQKEEVERVEWIDSEQLINEINQGSDKYIPSLAQAIEVLYNKGKNKFIL
jgi:isopentenyldiphosphate isomerase